MTDARVSTHEQIDDDGIRTALGRSGYLLEYRASQVLDDRGTPGDFSDDKVTVTFSITNPAGNVNGGRE